MGDIELRQWQCKLQWNFHLDKCLNLIYDRTFQCFHQSEQEYAEGVI